jgi:hypothetical protein
MSKPRHSALPPAPLSAPLAGIPRSIDRLLFVGLVVWTFLTLIFPLYDTDFWWHLKTGELMLRDGVVPHVDWYTFTDFEKPWIDLHWGFQILIALLYRLGGVDLIIVVKAAVITGAVAVGWLAAGKGLPVWVRVLAWLAPVVSISGRGYERPEMLSQLFLAIWLYIAFRVHERPKLIWWLPVVQLAWTNSHALFVLGLIVGGAYALDRLAREAAGGKYGLEPPVDEPSARTVIRAAALVVVVCFINPYFEEGVLFPLTLYRKFSIEQAFYSVRIGEFQQPIQFIRERGFFNLHLLAELGTWIATLSSFFWQFAKTGRFSLMRLLLFAAFSHLAWEATRNANIFAIVSAVVLCENLRDGLRSGGPRWSLAVHRRFAWGTAVVLAALSIMVVTGVWNRLGGESKPFRLGEAEEWFIHGAAKFAGASGMPRRAFVANNGQASVYCYHNGPERRVFMDARLEVCTRETFEIFDRILEAMAAGNPIWQEVFTRRGGELPIVILDSRVVRPAIEGMLHTPGWRLVYADGAAAVFLDEKRADALGLETADITPVLEPKGMRVRQPVPRK